MQSRSILLVDDCRAVLRQVSKLLAKIGYNDVDCAQTAELAIRLSQSRCYGLMICDYFLRSETACELITAMTYAGEKIPTIIMTGSEENVRPLFQASVNWLIKPFGVMELAKHIDAIV